MHYFVCLKAHQRPANSALAVDLDFERTMKPPPLPTEEHRKSIEDIVKKRILDVRFDDVIRVVPPAPKKEKKLVRSCYFVIPLPVLVVYTL